MKLARITFLGLVALIGALAAATAEAAQPTSHRELCVGGGSGCYKTVQAAVDAARSGDTVRIGRGTFAGGVTIRDKHSHRRSGRAPDDDSRGRAGADDRHFRSGDGAVGVDHRRRGHRGSDPFERSVNGPGQKTGVLALGGGIEVPPGHRFSDGATVTIRDSVITRNTVAPSASVRSGLPCGSACPFALAGGGGIDNWGSMTLTHVVVSNNVAGGGTTSDADAGGIYTPQGHLTLRHSVVTRNRAVASRPYGRFAEGAGVNITSTPFFLRPRRRISTLTIDASRITANAATLAESFPSDVEAHANTGGVLIAGDDDCTKPTSGCVRGTIRESLVSDNTATASNTAGDATAFGGGIVVDGVLLLSGSTIGNNQVRVKVPAGSSAGAFGDSAGIGMGGYATITDSRLVGNSVSAEAPDGTASAMFAGLSVGNGAFENHDHAQ